MLIQREQLEAQVKILPAVPYECLLDWTAAADIGLLLLPPDYSESIRKCLPNKFFEYLMAGLPMVVSRLDIVADLVQLYDVGIVIDDLIPEVIGESLMALMNNSEQMARMHEQALHTVDASGLCWEKEQKKLIRCYQSVLW
jgi:glycosyltransferase involved in cell wall biosynthesis